MSGAAVAGLTMLLVTACGGDDDSENAADTPAAVSSSPVASTPSPTITPSETPTEPVADATTFEQPFLPDEAVNTVELRAAIPIEPFDDASDEQLEVLEDAGHAWAAWEQVLWGVPFEETAVEEIATESYADHLHGYAQESVELERVSVGDPMRLVALSVDISGDSAETQICVDTTGWLDVFGAENKSPEISDPIWLGTGRYVRQDDTWIKDGVSYADDVSACEGVFQ